MQFNSSNYDYATYIHSTLDLSNGNGEITTLNITNSDFINLNRVAIMWTSQTNETEGTADGNNGNVGLNMNVENTVFRTSAVLQAIVDVSTHRILQMMMYLVSMM